MRKIYLLFAIACVSTSTFGQLDSTSAKNLENVVVTGQYQPQSVKNSVYQVRVINQERIRLSGATSIQQVLNTQLGFRFSNDNTLGVTDIQVMGMQGRNIKILLDGVPLNDRNDARESLGQIDINTIERIEIVEGPMSVSYGSDALAGVINIITKKNTNKTFSVNARVQEESAGNEYYPFSWKGIHQQHAGVSWGNKKWNAAVGFTHNDFDGFGGDDYGRGKKWLPKEQWMGNIKLGYTQNGFSVYYRLDGLDETIKDRQTINLLNYKAINKEYASTRYLHQVQSNWNINNKWQWNNIISFTDYERKTTTVIHDFEKNTDALSTGAGTQDLAELNAFIFRSTAQYRASNKFALQPGIEINRESASGGRIVGEPAINDYAAFVSAEIKPTSKINIRPGLRFIHNSQYDAPPVVPSLNTKFVLSKTLDLRLAYARGFRSPALRELYFIFNDANHNIYGNPDLKAEHSNSFTSSLNFTPALKGETRYNASLAGFYNIYNNRIELAQDANDASRYSYFNVGEVKTTGVTLENTIACKNLSATLGFSYIGFFSEEFDNKSYVREDDRDFLWTPEVNSNITYRINKIKTSIGVFYKYTGNKPFFAYGTNNLNQNVIYVAETSGYHTADVAITTAVHKYVTVQAGIKNLFDVANVNNTATGAGVHTTTGAVPIGYGRSYFLGLQFQWSKK